jgi:hypothetical protein
MGRKASRIVELFFAEALSRPFGLGPPYMIEIGIGIGIEIGSRQLLIRIQGPHYVHPSSSRNLLSAGRGIPEDAIISRVRHAQGKCSIPIAIWIPGEANPDSQEKKCKKSASAWF